MIKGISRQVIVVQSNDKKLFEQAIFILHDDAVQQGITDDMLLKEAQRVIQGPEGRKKQKLYLYGAFWSAVGAAAMGLVWLFCALL